MKRLMKILFPPGSRRRKMFEKTLKNFGLHRSGIDPMYQLVLEKNQGIQRILPKNLVLNKKPLISIVVPTYNPKRLFYDTLLNSVMNQSYENFELIIVNGSNQQKISNYIDKSVELDKRFKVIKVTNKGISETTNAGVRVARGEYVALLDHDDLLHPDALTYVVASINKFPDGDLFYSDECKITEDGEVFRMPHFKPNYSPDLLYNLNYITHLAVIRKSIFDKVGLFDSKKDGAQDYDMFLRITDYTKNIYHIPRVLYYWRESKISTATAFENKKDLAQSGINALQDHYQRQNIDAKVKIIKGAPGFYQAKINTPKKRAAVIVFETNPLITQNYLEHLKKKAKTKHSLEWFVMPSGVALGSEMISSLKNNFDVALAFVDLALPINKGVFGKLVSQVSQSHVGIVSPTLVDSFGRVVYKGEVGINKDTYPLFMGLEHNDKTNFGDVNWNRNVDNILKGLICFKTSLISKSNYKDSSEMIVDINHQCDIKKLYKTSLGKCFVEQVSRGEGDYETMLNASTFFNSNLRQYGYYENNPINSNTQLPVTNRYNILVDPNE